MLEINSGTVSKHMSVLESADLARRLNRSHSAYEPLFETRLRKVLQEVGNLKLEVIAEKRAVADRESADLSKAGIELVSEGESVG